MMRRSRRRSRTSAAWKRRCRCSISTTRSTRRASRDSRPSCSSRPIPRSGTGSPAATWSVSARIRGGTSTSTSYPARTASSTTCTPSAPTASPGARGSTPISATGTSATRTRGAQGMRVARVNPAAAGFTLIEILVVVLIIGLISAGMLLSMSLTGRDRELEKESDRLLALFTYAREQAELQTREYGVLFEDDGYEFLTYDPRRALWPSIFEDDALAA